MKLVLHRTSHDGSPDPTEARVLEDGALTIGRGAGCDWVLDDPDRTLSKLHCRIDRSADGYLLTDLSTNGVFLNNAHEPIGRGHVRALEEGDTIGLGPFSLAVTIEQPQPDASAFEPIDSVPIGGWNGQTGAPEPMQAAFTGVHQSPGSPIAPIPDEPWLQEIPTGKFGPDLRPAPIGWEAPPDPADFAATGARLDPLLSQPHGTEFAQDSEHLSAISTLMRTPAPQVVLPSDWNDKDPLDSVELARSHLANDILDSPPSAGGGSAMPDVEVLDRQQTETAAPEPAGGSAAADDFLAGFLEAAGLPPGCLAGADLQEAGRNLGRMMQASIEGVREVLATRAMVKSELRVDQTIIQAANNNAMKFAPDVRRCLAAMIAAPPPGFMPGSAAMQQSLNDIKLHELALVASLNSVFADLSTQLDPDSIMARVRSEAGVTSAVPMMREARCWAIFEENYRTLQEAGGVRNTGGSLLSLLATAYARQVRRGP
jgi:type VI secretion system FHA domain protein